MQSAPIAVLGIKPEKLGTLGRRAARAEIKTEKEQRMTRDSRIWWAGMVGGVAVAILAHSDQFPLLLSYPWVKEAVTLLSIIAAVVSGKMASSPLPHSDEAQTVKRP